MLKFLEATAGQYMTRTVQTVTCDMTVRELKHLVDNADFNTFPVSQGDDIVGLVTKFDLLKCFALNSGRVVYGYDELLSRKVADVMTPEFIYVEPGTKLTRVLQLMVDHRIRSIPVLATGHRLVGIIAREDVMWALTASAAHH